MSKKNFFNKLSHEERKIIVEKGTEKPFSGEYNDHFEAGIFICKACDSPLYESNTKFDSNCGWPSFDQEIKGAIIKSIDKTLGRIRTEICCRKCNGHLGHIFHGESITIKNTRHCVNSLSIRFKAYNHLYQATFGGGSFWDLEQIFIDVIGIYSLQVGYMRKDDRTSNYEKGCADNNNCFEVIHIYFDPKLITYPFLLEKYWEKYNLTTYNRQKYSIESKYKSIIFYYSKDQFNHAQRFKRELQRATKNKIHIQIKKPTVFHRAEEYHQNYLGKNNLGERY